MSKEKQQIEEMAKELAKIQCNKKGCEDCEFYQFECDDLQYYTKIAEALYNAGYRRQSEGEWETEELTKADSYLFFSHICSNCNYFYKDARPFGYDYCPNCGAKMKGGAEE